MDDEPLVMMRESEFDELIEEVRRSERARAVSIVIEEAGEITTELRGIICGEIDENG